MHKGGYSFQPVPGHLKPFIRRFMVANHETLINESIYPKATGYNYLNWVIDGLWQAENGVDFSSEKTPIFFSG